VALESIFEALELIFDVGFEFFGVFRLGLAGNEESRLKWWVTTGSTVAREVREKKKKKKKKTRGCVGVLFSF
jgi:hypothetical protein